MLLTVHAPTIGPFRLELNSSENITKQLEAKLERLNEERYLYYKEIYFILNYRRNILERMTYSSSSGAISSWVEKLQNIEGIIKVTKESLKRRANGLPPLPPPGLSHMQPAKQPQPENQSSGIIKPKGVSTTNKPIIGLGRGKRFSKQNSLPNGISETTATSVSGVPAASSPVLTVSSSNGMLAQSQLMKPQLSHSNEIFGQDQSRKQQQLATSSEMFGLNHFLQSSSNSESFTWSQPQLTSSTNEAFGQSQLQQLMMNNNNKDNQDQLKRQQNLSYSDDVFGFTHFLQQASSNDRLNQDQAKKQQLAGSSEAFGESKLQQTANSSELFHYNQPEKQQLVSSSEVFGQNKVQQLSSSREHFSHNQPPKKQDQMTNNNNTFDQTSSERASQKLPSNSGEQSQKHLGGMTSKQPLKNNEKTTDIPSSSAASVSNEIARSFAKLSLSHNAPPFTPAAIASTTTHSSSPTTPIATSRVMSYSSAVMSQPPRKPPPLMRHQQQITRTPIMHQPPPLLSAPPHVYGQNQHQVVGLGRGVGPWSPGPPPPLNSWGGNGHYVHSMPPPVHFNFDHHSPFYEVPSSGLHNPFYPIPPMGSSSGLDII